MSWIALKMLTGDKAKFFGIVLGLTFATLLITQQGSIFCGVLSRTAGQIHDITGADLWVMDPNVRFIDDVKPMIENNLYRVRGVEGVQWAVPLYKGIARAKLNSVGFRLGPDDKPAIDAAGRMRWGAVHEVIEQVMLLGLDDASMVGAPSQQRMLVGKITDLRQPDAVIVDYNRLRRLFPGENWDRDQIDAAGRVLRAKEPSRPSFFRKALVALGESARHPAQLARYLGSQVAWGGRALRTAVSGRPMVDVSPSEPYPFRQLEREYDRARGRFCERFVGRTLEMNDRRAVIVGVCDATRTFQSNAVVYTSYSRAKGFAPQERKVLTYVLAYADPRVGSQEVAGRISRQTGLRARTSRQFINETYGYYLKYTGIPINFGITSILGFVIGTAIAGQTFYMFTIDNLKQFGALKAMGATNGTIVRMILLQATVVGLLGYGMGVGLSALFGELTRGGELAFFTPWALLPISGGAVVLICVLSSALSVRRVVVLEPAVVFRG